MVKAERGADAIQWGKVFQQILQAGVRVVVDIPDASNELLESASRPARAIGPMSARGARPSAAVAHGGNHGHHPAAPARVLAAARLVLSPGEAAGAGADGTRRPRPRTTAAGSEAAAARGRDRAPRADSRRRSRA